MVVKLNYSFDDEPIVKFSYDKANKRIEINFDGYYNLDKDKYLEEPCIWIIENWEYAKCRIGDDLEMFDLVEKIGIFSLILYMKYSEDEVLEIIVNTFDNRYLTIFFKKPKFCLKLLENKNLE